MSSSFIIYISSAVQIIITLGLINVWLVRFKQPTAYRGKGAGNMHQEFLAYGLPVWFMYLVGTAKIIIATLMIIGFWIPVVIMPAAIILAILMIGAIAMHIKVGDSLKRTLPAIGMLVMALVIILIQVL